MLDNTGKWGGRLFREKQKKNCMHFYTVKREKNYCHWRRKPTLLKIQRVAGTTVKQRRTGGPPKRKRGMWHSLLWNGLVGGRGGEKKTRYIDGAKKRKQGENNAQKGARGKGAHLSQHKRGEFKLGHGKKMFIVSPQEKGSIERF